MNTSPQDPQIGSKRAWFIWSLAALAFGYAFFQRVTPGIMVQDLMSEFTIGAAVLGTLSALYFYPYVIMQIPLGVLIDRWGARLLLSLALTVAGIGSVVFATATSVELAYVGRLLIGVGSAVGFLGSLAIASKWFPPHRFAMLAGLGMFFGMMSGVFAQGPLATLVTIYGWRSVMWGLGGAGLVLALFIAIFVRDVPASGPAIKVPKQSWATIGKGLREAFSDWGVWKIAIVASTMSGPMLTLGGLWGTPYMESAYNLSTPAAASAVSAIFFGWAFGAPFSGWLSDRIRRRKIILVAGAGVLTVALGTLVFGPKLPLGGTVILFALIGISGGAMSVCFALVRECSPPAIGTSVTGIVNSMTVASGAILQPVVGYILDQLWTGTVKNGAPVYLETEFEVAFIAIFVAVLVGFLTTLTLKETPVWEIRN